jgi:hypothetical protein
MDLKVILLWVFIIIILYFIISYFFGTNYSNLTNTVANAQNMVQVPAASLGNKSASSNFAYSVWFNINDWNYKYGEYKVLFGRMGQSSGKAGAVVPGIGGLDPCPAVVLDAYENNLIIHMGCYPSSVRAPDPKVDVTGLAPKSVAISCNVSNIPIQKWVNLIVSVYGRSLDVYINGKLVKTCLLPGVAMVNGNSDVFLTPSGGFSGYTSKFQYYPNAIDPQYAWNIYENGYGPGVIGSMFGFYTFNFSLINNNTGDTVIKGSI